MKRRNRKEAEEAGVEENKYGNNQNNKRCRTPRKGSYDKNGHKRSKQEPIFN